MLKQGYEADNPNIELLRLRSFTMGRKLTDDQVMGPRGLETIMETITAMTPFVGLALSFQAAFS